MGVGGLSVLVDRREINAVGIAETATTTIMANGRIEGAGNEGVGRPRSIR